jgi:hypothetical protein
MYSEGTVSYTNRFGIIVQAPKKWINNIGWSTRNVTSANVENVTHSCPVGYNLVTCPSVGCERYLYTGAVDQGQACTDCACNIQTSFITGSLSCGSNSVSIATTTNVSNGTFSRS